MRLCRVCLTKEGPLPFKPIMQENCKIASNLFYFCGIEIIESNAVPALICPKCNIEVSNAVRLKRIALVADTFFRKQTMLEAEGNSYQELKESVELEIETYAFVEDDVNELIEYDEVEIEALVEDEDWTVVKHEEDAANSKRVKKPYAPRKPGGGRQIHQCQCGIIFSSNHRLRNHIRVKHEVVPDSEMLSCEICGKKFKIQEYLDLHVRNQHTNNSVKQRQKNPCSVCGKALSSMVALRNHEEKHFLDTQPQDKIKKFICDCCGQSFRMKSYLFNHMNNVHIRSKYMCALCSRGFYKKYEMMDHIRQYHTMETPFACEFEGCTKSFSRKKNYLIHKRIHTGERPYACSMCEKTFIHFIDRKRHMMKHTGERPFICSNKLCSKGFTRKTELETHMRLHYQDF